MSLQPKFLIDVVTLITAVQAIHEHLDISLIKHSISAYI